MNDQLELQQTLLNGTQRHREIYEVRGIGTTVGNLDIPMLPLEQTDLNSNSHYFHSAHVTRRAARLQGWCGHLFDPVELVGRPAMDLQALRHMSLAEQAAVMGPIALTVHSPWLPDC